MHHYSHFQPKGWGIGLKVPIIHPWAAARPYLGRARPLQSVHQSQGLSSAGEHRSRGPKVEKSQSMQRRSKGKCSWGNPPVHLPTRSDIVPLRPSQGQTGVYFRLLRRSSRYSSKARASSRQRSRSRRDPTFLFCFRLGSSRDLCRSDFK